MVTLVRGLGKQIIEKTMSNVHYSEKLRHNHNDKNLQEIETVIIKEHEWKCKEIQRKLTYVIEIFSID